MKTNRLFITSATIGVAALGVLAATPAHAATEAATAPAPSSAQSPAAQGTPSANQSPSPGPAATPANAAQGTSFGIDVSDSQKGINFGEAHSEGADFAVVKMGGLNVAPEHTSTNYAQQVDAARSAGMFVGHYYVPGKGQTPQQQADFFVNNLHNFDKNHDVLALDDEKLDNNGALMNDQEASAFMKEVINRTGISPDRVWFYIGKSNAQSQGPWTNVNALGVRPWVAAYGKDANSRTPTTSPDTGGALENVNLQQFSSNLTIAGKTVDGDQADISAKTLFNA